MGQFKSAVEAWVNNVKATENEICRAVALSLMTKIVMRSPVGDPELWAANAEAAMQRATHNDIVDQINSYLASDPANLTKKGNLKRKVKSAANKRLSRAQLAKEYPFRQGQGYVGGRFRGNWQISIGEPAGKELDRIDPNGAPTINTETAKLGSFTVGPAIYITNHLPYAHRLEYEAWSTQAPNGMVRITVEEFDQIVEEVGRELSQ